MRFLSTALLSVLLAFMLLSLKSDKKYYNENYRPQFHFSPEKNWQGSPAGLVFYKGKYHLFYQYNPNSLKEEALSWGHAVSTDLVHWKHLPVALHSGLKQKGEIKCNIFSGSVIIDNENVLGKQTGEEKTFVAFYSDKTCNQKIAYSTDSGITWEKLDVNPVIKTNKDDGASGPKVFWHAPSKRWVLLLHRKESERKTSQGISIYTSENLIDWELKSHVHGFSGSSDLVEFQVTNRPDEKKWILFDSNGSYLLGSFDGEKFNAESPRMKSDYGRNYYAVQTCQNTDDNRIIQLAWMRYAEFPNMPFNGQMSFPNELKLTKFVSGYKLIRTPVAEIKSLHGKHYKWENKDLIPGLDENKTKKVSGDCLHIIADFDIKTSDNFGFMLRSDKKQAGIEVLYNVKRGTLNVLGSNIPLMPIDNHIKLEILLDRTSLEIYANDGQAVASNCFVANEKNDKVILYTNGGELGVVKLDVYKMESVWRDK